MLDDITSSCVGVTGFEPATTWSQTIISVCNVLNGRLL